MADLRIEQFDNARIIYKNFEGAASKYNRKGERNFGLVITDPDRAQEMIDNGWNVKIRPPRTEDESVFYWIPVKVNMDQRNPPPAYLVSRGNMLELDAESIKELDTVAIEKVNLDIRPYSWSVDGNTGVAAYLQGIKVWQKYNRFETDDEPTRE